jgi:hypothetical protein
MVVDILTFAIEKKRNSYTRIESSEYEKRKNDINCVVIQANKDERDEQNKRKMPSF